MTSVSRKAVRRIYRLWHGQGAVRVLNGARILTDGGQPSHAHCAAAAIIAGHFDIDLASGFQVPGRAVGEEGRHCK